MDNDGSRARLNVGSTRWRAMVSAGICATTLLSLACGESGSCGDAGELDGVYVSVDPAASMDITECDGEVSGTLTFASVDFELSGTLTNDVFEWGTTQVDLCATLGVRRQFSSNSRDEFIVDAEAENFAGSFYMASTPCVSGLPSSRGYTTTFGRD